MRRVEHSIFLVIDLRLLELHRLESKEMYPKISFQNLNQNQKPMHILIKNFWQPLLTMGEGDFEIDYELSSFGIKVDPYND